MKLVSVLIKARVRKETRTADSLTCGVEATNRTLFRVVSSCIKGHKYVRLLMTATTITVRAARAFRDGRPKPFEDPAAVTPNFGEIPLANFEWHFKPNVTTNFDFFGLSYTPPHSEAQKCGARGRT